MLKLNRQNDSDILSQLDSKENKQGYIKELIRKDMRGSSGVLPVEMIGRLILPVAQRYGIKSVFLFGSYARGEATATSDVDLLIEGGSYEGMFDYMAVKESFEAGLGKNVDLVEMKSLERRTSRAGIRFRAHIERDKVLIYERA
ncbi:MAG: nucleotidyltransferase domain-containing protein [Firmicutes bacterium]|nr:nucleotidyltransferase domain-containing protein [Bacillota bacterium]